MRACHLPGATWTDGSDTPPDPSGDRFTLAKRMPVAAPGPPVSTADTVTVTVFGPSRRSTDRGEMSSAVTTGSPLSVWTQSFSGTGPSAASTVRGTHGPARAATSSRTPDRVTCMPRGRRGRPSGSVGRAPRARRTGGVRTYDGAVIPAGRRAALLVAAAIVLVVALAGCTGGGDPDVVVAPVGRATVVEVVEAP